MKLDARSVRNLIGVNGDLVRVVTRAAELTELDFVVTEGVRTVMRQAELVKAGASRTMNSKHITGRAVDLAAVVDGDVRWDWPLYTRLSLVMKQAAHEVGVKIAWGGDWTTWKDGPHFELT